MKDNLGRVFQAEGTAQTKASVRGMSWQLQVEQNGQGTDSGEMRLESWVRVLMLRSGLASGFFSPFLSLH